MQDHKHCGILAHSAEGAALCFLEFCREGHAKIGAHQHPDVSLDCIALGKSMGAWDGGKYDAIRATLAQSADRLAKAGAEFFVCPDNTAHIALERPGPELAIPGLNIADVVAGEAARAGMRRVGVLGTKYLMDGPVYRRSFEARGIGHLVPGPAERERIDRIIFDELVAGRFTEPSRTYYMRIIADLKAQGCDGVALVCTEIPLLLTPEMSLALPALDSTRLLANAAFEVAVGAAPMPTWRGGPIPA